VAIPADEALPIAKQTAEALEAAHEHGVIHRDLNLANIKRTSGGTVKVLDFGLAKAVETSNVGRNFSSARSAGGQEPAYVLSQLATISLPAMTTGGVMLGTAARTVRRRWSRSFCRRKLGGRAQEARTGALTEFTSQIEMPKIGAVTSVSPSTLNSTRSPT
jgi:serine/threonine protein kinase